MKTVVVTTVWNTVGLLEPFLSHLRCQGVFRVLAMDFGSSDGSAELLASPRWQDLVEIMPFPGLRGLDSSNLMLGVAKSKYPDAWAMFCDPDEFFCSEGQDLATAAGDEEWQRFDVVELPRYNMVGVATDIERLDHEPFYDVLRYSIRKPHHRDMCERLEWNLRSPWIFSAIPGKVVVRLAGCSSIGPGDHTADSLGKRCLRSKRAWLQHYPLRTYSEFEQKMRLAAEDLAANPQLPATDSWHWRRWVNQHREGMLHAEYVSQFVSRDDFAELLDAGLLVDEPLRIGRSAGRIAA